VSRDLDITERRAHLPKREKRQSQRWGIDQHGQPTHDISHEESVLIDSTPPNRHNQQHEKMGSSDIHDSETPTPKSHPMASQRPTSLSAVLPPFSMETWSIRRLHPFRPRRAPDPSWIVFAHRIGVFDCSL